MSHAFVVLSTFNGERFLAEQIESLRGQTHADWTLLVRDDGSTDGTLSILQKQADRDSRIRRIMFDGRRLGPSQSFGVLLEEALRQSAERVFLSDQDDVWSSTKMERQLARLTHAEFRSPAGTPLLVHSDLEVVDERLNVVHPSFLKSQRLRHVSTNPLATLVVQNFVTGCTVLLNRAAVEVALPISTEAVMHDWWIALCTAGSGKLLFDPEPTVRYRQHSGNAIGATAYWTCLWNALQRRTAANGWIVSETPREFAAVLLQAEAAADRLADVNPQNARWLAEFVDLWRKPALPGKRLASLRRLKPRRLDPLRHLLLQARLAFAAQR